MEKFEDTPEYGLKKLREKITGNVIVYEMMQLEGLNEDEIKKAKINIKVLNEKTGQMIDRALSIEDYSKNLGLTIIPLDNGLIALVKFIEEKTDNTNNAGLTTETLKSIIPKSYHITNNKLSNEMTKDFINQGNIELAVIKSGKKGEVLTYNSLTYDNPNISITGKQEFTAYDRTIHNAVCTLYAAGNKEITPAMVYRTANGMTDKETVSPQAIEAVTQSLDKSRFLRLKVDYKAEARVRGITDVKKFEIDSYLFPAKMINIAAGGYEVTAYQILDTPALYHYAQLTKQIISVSLPLLDTREATRNTEEMIPIKEYLIRRIEIMKHNDDTSNRIVYDTIFSEAGITELNKDKSYNLRTYIKAILKLWQNKKYIKSFKEYKEGKSIKGVEIIY